jgi:hypothetical protein
MRYLLGNAKEIEAIKFNLTPNQRAEVQSWRGSKRLLEHSLQSLMHCLPSGVIQWHIATGEPWLSPARPIFGCPRQA